VLLGLGSGALAAALAEGLPPILPVGALCVCEQDLALVRALRVAGKVEPIFVEDIAAMPAAILEAVRDGDVVITMGAGSIGGVPARLSGGRQ
jgi:hypothetical protein